MLNERLVDVALAEEDIKSNKFITMPISQLKKYMEEQFSKNLSIEYILIRYHEEM